MPPLCTFIRLLFVFFPFTSIHGHHTNITRHDTHDLYICFIHHIFSSRRHKAKSYSKLTQINFVLFCCSFSVFFYYFIFFISSSSHDLLLRIHTYEETTMKHKHSKSVCACLTISKSLYEMKRNKMKKNKKKSYV